MLLFFRIFVWVCFVGLGVYIYLFGKYEKKMDGKEFLIRKIWYLLYLFGALLYWTVHPKSIFHDWKNYLIVLVIFILVDTFIFLNMYIRKIGNHELERLTKTVSNSESLIQENLSMMKNLLHFLNNEEIVGYYGSEEEYLIGLQEVLQSYAEKDGMTINILPFKSVHDKNQALISYPNPNSIRSKLDRLETYYNDEDKFALHPVYLLGDELYILKISASRPVSEMDCLLFGVLIYIYDFAVPEDAEIKE